MTADPKSEAEFLSALRAAGRDVGLAWAAMVGAVQRAQLLKQAAEAANVAGAERMLPACAHFLSSRSPMLWDSLRELAEREFATREELRAAFDGTKN